MRPRLSAAPASASQDRATLGSVHGSRYPAISASLAGHARRALLHLSYGCASPRELAMLVTQDLATLGSTQESARSHLIGGMVRPGGDVLSLRAYVQLPQHVSDELLHVLIATVVQGDARALSVTQWCGGHDPIRVDDDGLIVRLRELHECHERWILSVRRASRPPKPRVRSAPRERRPSCAVAVRRTHSDTFIVSFSHHGRGLEANAPTEGPGSPSPRRSASLRSAPSRRRSPRSGARARARRRIPRPVP